MPEVFVNEVPDVWRRSGCCGSVRVVAEGVAESTSSAASKALCCALSRPSSVSTTGSAAISRGQSTWSSLSW